MPPAAPTAAHAMAAMPARVRLEIFVDVAPIRRQRPDADVRACEERGRKLGFR